MILPIYTYGQAALRAENKPVERNCPNLQQLIDDMFETMYRAEGVGLAAPQVGLSVQLLIIDADAVSKNHPECKGFKRVMINPEILEHSKETVSAEEGCLSFPDIHEKITRAQQVKVRYFDADFVEHEETFADFNARIVQHECEHLAGGVFIDNISPIRRQLNKSKLNRIVKGAISCDYKIKPIKK
ncbi:MAG: peptide deformylase [Tannerella sp.]|jgi:peptide deformylase|nr:peptide deformylase [Tannerella sp.]